MSRLITAIHYQLFILMSIELPGTVDDVTIMATFTNISSIFFLVNKKNEHKCFVLFCLFGFFVYICQITKNVIYMGGMAYWLLCWSTLTFNRRMILSVWTPLFTPIVFFSKTLYPRCLVLASHRSMDYIVFRSKMLTELYRTGIDEPCNQGKTKLHITCFHGLVFNKMQYSNHIYYTDSTNRRIFNHAYDLAQNTLPTKLETVSSL